MSLFLLFWFFLSPEWLTAAGQVVLNLSKNRSRSLHKKEDYTFESKLKRATEECSYIARNDDESHRLELIQRIKDEINNRKVEEFYREQEAEKKKSKEYYDNVEREMRKKVLSEGNGLPPPSPPNGGRERRPWNSRRTALPPGPPPPPLPPPPHRRIRPASFPDDPRRPPFGGNRVHGGRFQRSSSSKDASFSQGTFKEHNNCFSRCVFGRMELVDFLGFPQESYLRKALEDHVDNRKVRFTKIRRLRKCFDDVKKVAIDDNCIYSTKIFRCMRLDEPGSWY